MHVWAPRDENKLRQIGRWLREAWGEDSGNAEAMNTLSLASIVRKLLPDSVHLLQKHHSAGPDALLHRRLAYAVYGLGRGACRLSGGAHQMRKTSNEEGESVMECSLCEERF